MSSSSGDELEDREWVDGARGLQATNDSSPSQGHRPPREMRTRVANGNDTDHTTTHDSTCTSLLWEGAGKAPLVMRRGTATVAGDTIFVNSTDSQEVYAYRDVATATSSWRGELKEGRGQWLKVADYPVRYFSLAVVGSKVTGIGGISDGLLKKRCSSQLLSLEEGRWARVFPPMPTPRGFTGVVATETHLVVAGGGSRDLKLPTVEILDVASRQWTAAPPLPQPFTSVSMAMLGGRVYLAGFFSQLRTNLGTSLLASHSVISCTLTSLLSPRQPSGGVAVNVGGVGSESEASEGEAGVASTAEVGGASIDTWKNLMDLPTACSTLVALGNRVVAVGGVLLSGPYSSEVYGFNPDSNSWSVIGRLGVQRSLPLAAVVPGNRLVVVGGLKPNYSWGGTCRSDGVEIFTAIF